MNSIAPNHKINKYDDLTAERIRLEDAIKIQKMRIRHDMDELKIEARTQFQPVADAAEFVKKLASPATRNDTLLGIGTNLTLEVLIRRLFAKSNLFIQIIVPTLLKNYSSHVLHSMLRNMQEKRQNGLQAKAINGTYDKKEISL
jgi:hypothetical protein